MLEFIRKQTVALAIKANPSQGQEIAKSTSETMNKVILSHLDEMINNAAISYANTYSIDELKQIIAFYKSPIGQKMVDSTPRVMQQMMALNTPIVMQSNRELRQMLDAYLRQRGLNVPQATGR